MGVVSGIIMRTTEQAYPFFSPQRCMNRRQTKHPCHICNQLCPSGAVPANPAIQKIDWEKCKNCGVCVTACPSRCFAPDLETQKNLSAPARGRTAIFACDRAEIKSGVSRVECLCGIPWEWLAALALRLQVVLYVGGCQDCQAKECRERLEENLRQIRLFLGTERTERSLVLLYDTKEIAGISAGVQMNRRDFFHIFTSGMKKTVAYGVTSVMPMPRDDPAQNGFTYRRLLADVVWQEYEAAVNGQEKPQDTLPVYEVLLPNFIENCFGCGLCVKVCPQQALKVSGDGEGRRIISIAPWKCTGCGLCGKTCIHGGIDGMARMQVHHLQMQGYVRVYHEKCRSCGAVIPVDTPDGMCIACTARNKKRKAR